MSTEFIFYLFTYIYSAICEVVDVKFKSLNYLFSRLGKI